MRLYFDIDLQQFIQAITIRAPISALRTKRADSKDYELVFVQGGVVQEKPSGTIFRFSLKKPNDFQGVYLVTTSAFTKAGTGVDTVYSFSPNFNTAELNDFLVDGTVKLAVADNSALLALASDDVSTGDIVRQSDAFQYWRVKSVDDLGSMDAWELAPLKVEALCDSELEWVEPGPKRSSSVTIPFYVNSDLNRGTESLPASASPGYWNRDESDARYLQSIAGEVAIPAGQDYVDVDLTAHALTAIPRPHSASVIKPTSGAAGMWSTGFSSGTLTSYRIHFNADAPVDGYLVTYLFAR